MSATDKLRNRLQIAWGRVNKQIGRLAGARSGRAKGRGQRLSDATRQAGERVKDAGQGLRNALRR